MYFLRGPRQKLRKIRVVSLGEQSPWLAFANRRTCLTALAMVLRRLIQLVCVVTAGTSRAWRPYFTQCIPCCAQISGGRRRSSIRFVGSERQHNAAQTRLPKYVQPTSMFQRQAGLGVFDRSIPAPSGGERSLARGHAPLALARI